MIDLILANGLILDGTGSSPFFGSIGIDKGKIVSIGDELSIPAYRLIDISGLAVSPGFIDGHTHAEGYTIAQKEPFLGKIFQGVTTEILGNCGFSVIPVSLGHRNDLKTYFKPFSGGTELRWDWKDLSSFAKIMDQQQLLINTGTMIGHGSLRLAVMGYQERTANQEEIEKMSALLKIAFDQGALGLSFGLIYPPGAYADTNEIMELAKVAAAYNRPVTCHLRSETFGLVESVIEMIGISENSGARLIISHHKAIGRKNWEQLSESLELIDQANARGVDIYIDVYPYTAANTMLRSLLPPWVLDGGIEKMLAIISNESGRKSVREWIYEREDWENFGLAVGWDSIMISSSRKNLDYKGRFISDLAENSGKDPVDFLMDFLIIEKGQGMTIFYAASEPGLKAAMSKSYCMIASDGIPAVGGVHPRLYGTFPRFISHFVLNEKLMSIEEGIRRVTSLPAQVFGLNDRGEIRLGKIADLSVFNPHTFSDKATYNNPEQVAEGIEYLVINGKLCLEQNRIITQEAGRFLLAQ